MTFILLAFVLSANATSWYDPVRNVTCVHENKTSACKEGQDPNAPVMSFDHLTGAPSKALLTCGLPPNGDSWCLIHCLAENYCNSHCDNKGICRCYCWDNTGFCVDTSCK